MNKTLKPLLLLVLLAFPLGAAAFEPLPTNSEEYYCYSKSMIGFDSVINSRLGVPAEHALDLAILPHRQVLAGQQVYSRALLNTILNAYLWQDSPHTYAIKVFYRCAQRETLLQSAQSDWLTVDY